MSRRVIINADDLGIDEQRSQGILQAHRKGVVTSATLLANSPDLEALADQLAAIPKLGVGVHLNLSHGEAILSHPRTLTDSRGRFFGPAEALRRIMEGRYDEEEIRTEFDLQIRRVVAAGLQPSHLDSHHHIHVYPMILNCLCWAAHRHQIQKVRLPREPVPEAGKVASQIYWEMIRFQGLMPRATEILEAEGMRTTDHFRGLTLRGGLHFDRFLDVLARLPEGSTEVMVHPARRGEETRNLAMEEREKELRILVDPETRKAIDGYGIELISFRDL